MQNIKYILVNDAAAKGSACQPGHRFIPHIGHCIVVEAGGFSDGFKFFAEQSGKAERQVSRSKLLNELVRLRKHWPEAKILGVSELDTSASHAPVRVNPEMNKLRRELSDLP